MSDRQSDLEFKLQHIVIAMKDVATEWYDLGPNLGLPDSSLKLIGSNPDIEGHLRMMLSKWLDYDMEASWEKLASALNTMGKNKVAANIRSKFVGVATTYSPVADDDKTCQEINRNILRKIKCQFASLQLDVRTAIETRQVKVSDVHQFFVASFQGESCIPEAADLTKLFNIITEARLWSYDHYLPLQELAEQFLHGDEQVQKHIADYQNQLSGFYTTTKIIDFINLSELEEFEDDPQQPFSPEKYKKYYRQLKVKLKLKNITELTLCYVNTLWQSFAEEFGLPSLTAVIDKIIEGSIVISWLILPQCANIIRSLFSKSLKFYQQHGIVEIHIDYELLYYQEWIEGSTPLYQASFMGNTDEVKKLLEDGADVNQQNHNMFQEAALLGACRGGHAETVRVLLDHGANVNYKNKDDMTGLMWASVRGYIDTLRMLLEAKADPNIFTKSHQTALHWAAVNGRVEVIKALVNYGAIVDIRDKDGWTGLMWASEGGHLEAIRALLEAKADPNINNEDGWTALHRASLWGHEEIVLMLINRGASVDIRNKAGLNALDVAVALDHQSVCEVLKQYTKQEKKIELTEDQKESVYQRLFKLLERTFLQEQVKKTREQQKKEDHQREERARGEKEKRSLWNRLKKRRNLIDQM